MKPTKATTMMSGPGVVSPSARRVPSPPVRSRRHVPLAQATKPSALEQPQHPGAHRALRFLVKCKPLLTFDFFIINIAYNASGCDKTQSILNRHIYFYYIFP